MKSILRLFKKNLIETRPIVTGDFTNQPVMKYYNKKNLKYKLQNCSLINDQGIMIGNSHVALTKVQQLNLKRTFDKINELINKS